MTSADSLQAQMAELLDLQRRQGEQLAHLATRSDPSALAEPRFPLTIAELVPRVQAEIRKERTRGTYATTFRRMVSVEVCLWPDADGRPRDPALCAQAACPHTAGGALLAHDYTPARIKQLALWVHRRAVQDKRRQLARRRLVVMRRDDPDVTLADVVVGDDDLPVGCGNDALRGYMDASAYFWRAAVRNGHATVNPMDELADDAQLRPDRNPLGGTRSLAAEELAHLEQVVLLSGVDPDLDHLLVWFHYETGARMSEAIRLVIDELDPHRQVIRLGKKGDVARDQPVSLSLIEALLAHAVARGARYDHERVFRVRHAGRVHPLSESHYTRLWKRVAAHADWAARSHITTHALRKTGATTLERLCSPLVAEAFLGHRRSSGDSNTTYWRVAKGELETAVELLTGEYHPGAIPRNCRWLPADYVRPAPA